MDKILKKIEELKTDISIGLDNETSSVVERLGQIQNDLEQLELCGVVRCGNSPNLSVEFMKAKKQLAKACKNYLNSKEYKAMIEAFKKVGAID